MISSWSKNEIVAIQAVGDPDMFVRVSCKIDAAMMVVLCRPNKIIRDCALKIIHDFQTITDLFVPQKDKDYISLYTIIKNMDGDISRFATFAFLEDQMRGDCITAEMISKITILSLKDVAASDFFDLFKYYHGELARLFVIHGRAKALRHCAKFLRAFALPFVTSSHHQSRSASLASYWMLLFSFAGVPLNSDVKYSFRSISSLDDTLLSNIMPKLYSVFSINSRLSIHRI